MGVSGKYFIVKGVMKILISKIEKARHTVAKPLKEEEEEEEYVKYLRVSVSKFPFVICQQM